MIATEPFLYRHFRIREAIRYPLILHFLACPRVILGEAVTAQEMAAEIIPEVAMALGEAVTALEMAAATILVAAMVLGEAETVTEAVITQAEEFAIRATPYFSLIPIPL